MDQLPFLTLARMALEHSHKTSDIGFFPEQALSQSGRHSGGAEPPERQINRSPQMNFSTDHHSMSSKY
jgi:hypothetical protein